MKTEKEKRPMPLLRVSALLLAALVFVFSVAPTPASASALTDGVDEYYDRWMTSWKQFRVALAEMQTTIEIGFEQVLSAFQWQNDFLGIIEENFSSRLYFIQEELIGMRQELGNGLAAVEDRLVEQVNNATALYNRWHESWVKFRVAFEKLNDDMNSGFQAMVLWMEDVRLDLFSIRNSIDTTNGNLDSIGKEVAAGFDRIESWIKDIPNQLDYQLAGSMANELMHRIDNGFDLVVDAKQELYDKWMTSWKQFRVAFSGLNNDLNSGFVQLKDTFNLASGDITRVLDGLNDKLTDIKHSLNPYESDTFAADLMYAIWTTSQDTSRMLDGLDDKLADIAKNLNPYESDTFASDIVHSVEAGFNMVYAAINDGVSSICYYIYDVHASLNDMLTRELQDIRVLLNEIRNGIYLNTDELQRQTAILNEQAETLRELADKLNALMDKYGGTGGGETSGGGAGGSSGGSNTPDPDFGSVPSRPGSVGGIQPGGAVGDGFTNYTNVVYVVWDIPVLREMLLTMCGLFIISVVLFGKAR